jgi:hypothetical protein
MNGPDRAQRLERRYRRLLRAYPASYREQRSDEMVAVLMSAAEPGRRSPSLAEAADLVQSGLRTRVTFARRDLGAPVSTRAIRHAGLVMLVVATAVAGAVVVGVTVLGYTVFQPGQLSNQTYPEAVRIGVGVVLGAFPAALFAQLTGRSRIGRNLATLGALGSVGAGVLLVVHALGTRTEDVDAAPLFGLVLLLCLPAVLLSLGAAGEDDRDHARTRWAVLAVLLTVAFVVVVAGSEFFERVNPSAVTFLGTHSLFETGLNAGVAVVLGVIGIWSIGCATLRRDDPEPRAVVWALSVPVVGSALGVLLSPGVYSPIVLFEWHLVQVAWFGATLGVFALIGWLTLSSVRRAAANAQ